MNISKLKTFFCFLFFAGSYAVHTGAADFSGGEDTEDSLLGTGKLSIEEMTSVLTAENPDIDDDFARDFSALYIKEAEAEGINHDIAFSQMCYETNFLKFDNKLSRRSNNFGGIGGAREYFRSALIGVRAQIQHLKAYATEDPPAQKLVDPCYYNVRFGSAPTLYGLSGKWSADLSYGEKVKNLLEYAAGGIRAVASN